MLTIKNGKTASSAISFCLLLFTACFLLAKRLPTVDKPTWNLDETVECLVAQDMIHGKIIYHDTITHRAPLQHFLFAVLFKLFGPMNMKAVHYALILCILYVTGILYLIGKQTEGRVFGSLAGLLFTVMISGLAPCDIYAFHTEFVLVACSSTAALLLLQGLRKGKASFSFGAGICLGLCFFSKQPGLLEMAGMSVFLGLESFRSERRPFLLASLGAMAAGFVLVCLAFAAYFTAHHAFRDFLYYFWFYNTDIYVGTEPLAQRLRSSLGIFYFPHFSRVSPWMLLGLVVYPLYLAAGRRLGRRRDEPAPRLFMIWMWFSYFATMLSGRNFGHYFVQPMVPASLIAAWMIYRLFCRLAAPGSGRLILLRVPAACAVCSVLAYGLFFPYQWKMFWQREAYTPEVARVSQYIKDNSASDDAIQVWGFLPEFYLLSGRIPASRFNQTNFLTGMLPWVNHKPGVDTTACIVPGSWPLFLEDLERNRPLFIIDISPGNNMHYGKYPVKKFPEFQKFIEAHYDVDRTFSKENGSPDFRLWRRKAVWGGDRPERHFAAAAAP